MIHSHDSWEWSVAFQKDRGFYLVLIERPAHYAWLGELGSYFLCFANAKYWWRLAALVRAYWVADYLLNKSEKKNKELLTIDLTPEQTKALVGDEWWPWGEEDDDAGDL
jgi:hypothetical protein